MTMNKNLQRMILVLALALMFVGVMAGCMQEEEKILLAYDVFEHEYGEIFCVPEAVCVTGEEVTIQIFDAEGNEVPIEYGACTLEKGEYKMVCTAGEYTREVPLICQDTTAPKIVVSYDENAAVGHWYVLPSATVSDLSGVDKSEIKVELYVEGQDTPVASGAGERVRIEDVESYILKVSAKDRAGNVSNLEKKIKPIVRPETELLQDFSTQVNPSHISSWGGGSPVFQWYEEFDGKQGVIGLGANGAADEKGFRYIWWTGLGMDRCNLVGATAFTLRIKADHCRAIYIKSSQNNDAIKIMTTEHGEWMDVTVSLVNEEGVFTQLSNAVVGLAVAPEGFYDEVCVWVDQITVHYTPYEEYEVTIENGILDYPYDTIPEGRVVKIMHDDTKTPAGKVFAYFEHNGNRVWEDSITVNENGHVKPVYVDLVAEEKAIPEGAVMIEDFSKRGLAVQDQGDTAWSGSGVSVWYASYNGAAGVRSLGVLPEDGEAYSIRWSALLPPDFAYSAYNYITFRVMVNKSAIGALWTFNGAEAVNILDYTDAGNMVWADIKVPSDKVNSFYLGVTNVEGQSGELVWIDQIFATND